MRCALLKAYGPAENFILGEIDKPAIAADEILVRVHASSVNPVDWKIRNGSMKMFSGKTPPPVLGHDFAGEVAEVGAQVNGYKAGDKVYGMTNPLKGGCYAEFVKVKTKNLAPMPTTLGFNEAAALPLAALTAWQALTKMAQLKSGQEVLVNGGSSAVGIAAIQMAKVLGARVTATCSARNTDFVRGLGADEVIDYTKEDVTRRTSHYDVLFDCAGTLVPNAAKAALKPVGFFITTEPIMPLLMFGPLLNKFRSRKAGVVGCSPNSDDLRAIAQLVEQGKLKPVVEQVFPLAQIAAAHTRSETRRAVGKLVIQTA